MRPAMDLGRVPGRTALLSIAPSSSGSFKRMEFVLLPTWAVETGSSHDTSIGQASSTTGLMWSRLSWKQTVNVSPQMIFSSTC